MSGFACRIFRLTPSDYKGGLSLCSACVSVSRGWLRRAPYPCRHSGCSAPAWRSGATAWLSIPTAFRGALSAAVWAAALRAIAFYGRRTPSAQRPVSGWRFTGLAWTCFGLSLKSRRLRAFAPAHLRVLRCASNAEMRFRYRTRPTLSGGRFRRSVGNAPPLLSGARNTATLSALAPACSSGR